MTIIHTNIVARTLEQSHTLVIKIGSSLIVDDDGTARFPWLTTIAQDITALSTARKVIVVSSGAIALGRARLGIGSNALSLGQKQAIASIGQAQLIHLWQRAFDEVGARVHVWQILLGRKDFRLTRHRDNILSLCRGLQELTQQHHLTPIPVLNENDATDVREIRFGDNDQLAAQAGVLFQANPVILLSKGIDGLYDRQGQIVPHIPTITDSVRAMVRRDSTTTHGTGGMATKLTAAEVTIKNGGCLMIARGDIDHPLHRLRTHSIGTVFGTCPYCSVPTGGVVA